VDLEKYFIPRRGDPRGITMWRVVDADKIPYSPYKTGVADIKRVLEKDELEGMRFSGFGFLQVPPGGEFRVHVHPEREEIYYVLSGSGTVEIKGKPVKAQPGITIHISGETPHGIKNDGEEPLTIIYTTAWV